MKLKGPAMCLILMLVSGWASAATADIARSPGVIPVDLTPRNNYSSDVTLDGSFSEGTNLSYTWELNDETVGSGVEKTVEFTRENDGIETVALVVVGDFGTDRTSVDVELSDTPSASVSPETAYLDLSENQTARFTSTVNNSFDRPPGRKAEYTWSVEGETQGSSKSLTHTFSSTGIKTVTLNVSDTAGRFSVESSQVQVVDTVDNGGNSDEGGGGSGGGGGGSFRPPNSSENTDNNDTGRDTQRPGSSDVEDFVVSQNIRDISPNNPAEIDVSSPGSSGLEDITLSGSTDSEIEVRAQQLDEEQNQIVDVNGTGYKYFNITVDGGRISRATIGFRVERDWLDQRNIEPASVVMERFNGSWTKLDTRLADTKPRYHSYKALTSDFSIFAVSTNKAPAENLQDTEPNLTTSSKIEKNKTERDTNPDGKDNSMLLMIGAVTLTAVVLALVGAYVYRYNIIQRMIVKRRISRIGDEIEDDELTDKEAEMVRETIDRAQELAEEGDYDEVIDILDEMETEVL